MIKLKRNKYLKNDFSTENQKISIQFSLDGFSFCISDCATSDIIVLSEYHFTNPTITLPVLLEQIQQIFRQDSDLHLDFKNIEVIHQNNLSTIVPNAFFEKKQLKNYLKYTIKTLDNDYVTFDDLQSISAKMVYIPYVNINNYLFHNFGEFDFKHHSTVLIEKLLFQFQNNFDKLFFVNVLGNHIDIVIIQYNKLIFYNSFSVKTKEDFIYYILFVAEQLNMDPNKFQLFFIGDIDQESDFYNITFTYIRHVNFVKPIRNHFENVANFLPHFNYTLVS